MGNQELKEGIFSEIPARIDISDVSVIYNNRPALDHVSLSVPHGLQVAVVGPNGAGKSTLFKLLVGLIHPDTGTIQIHSQPLGDDAYCVAYVPQREEVDLRFPVTVQEVIMMGRYRHYGLIRKPSQNDREIVRIAMKRLGIQKLANSSLNELSGGQLQRVFLARAIAQEPHILLMDEPFNGVDLSTQEATFELLDELKKQQVTVMVSTHDLNMAATRFEAIVLLRHRLIAYGKPAEVMKREHLAAAFGEQLFMLDGAALVDHCCPPDSTEVNHL
ncbi:metal ABC transporter ATP-binding protein [Leptolinea tardivitalis]|uniref:ABC transporter n=1 Tax=Leptolinea tardivitalis TaxID=229920 RepID=A0A0P6X5W1_9CHLR|nr:metal ABC transporter ATP-binding protein [Leptolinea tardivitalis]KPL74750.1 ABC transporter [Leptolinea tardivitalis]GAP22878.1 ABC-type Mn/Zn transport system, ATPase component [Leptolinea tardivitalis]